MELMNIQLQWLKDAEAADQQFVSMIVGWQTVAETLNATVNRFNAKFLQQSDDKHHEMKVIAAKQAVMASLKELRLALEKWFAKLRRERALSAESETMWTTLQPTLQEINAFRDIRNCAFHFSDFIDPPADMIAIYEDVQSHDIDELSTMLGALYDLGFQFRADAMAALGK